LDIIICLLLFGFTFLGYKIFGNILNPITIFISWSLLLVLLGMWSNVFRSEYTWKTFVILLISYSFFTIGSLFGKWFNAKKSIDKEVSFSRLSLCIVVLSVVVDFCIVLYILDLSVNFGIFRIFSHLSSYNIAVQSGFFSGKIYYQVLHIAIPLSMFILYYLLRGVPKHRYLLKLEFVLCFLPFISVRRDTLFKMIILNLLLWYLISIFKPAHKKFSETLRRRAKIVIVLIVAIAFMAVTQKLLNKSYEISGMRIFGIQIPDFLISPISYLLGNFPYLNLKIIANDISYQGFLISTLRIPYIYLKPIFSGTLDLTTPFALSFLNIGNGVSIRFNTAPIQYYTMIEMGLFYPLYYFLLGSISCNAYRKFIRKQGFSETLVLVILFSILFWSVREYILIYLSTWVLIITVFVVCKIVLVKKR